MIEPVYGFQLFVNQQLVDVRKTLEEAQKAATQHVQNRAELQIKDTAASKSYYPSRIWNYHYDVNQWIERIQG